MTLSRRDALFFAGAGAASLAIPASAFAADARGKRLVLVILRGGLDGLSAVAPIGDPDHVRARRGIALPNPGEKDGGLPLDGFFALHPALPQAHAMYQAGELLCLHAVSTPYRERSHFDAQNVLETGAGQPFARDAGWLNAALAALPVERKAGRKELGIALSAQAPLVARGGAAMATWSPSPLPNADSDTLARLMDLYRKRDAALAEALEGAAAANAMVSAEAMDARNPARAFVPIAKAAATFLKRPDGPVAAVLEMSGFDTHAQQAGQLSALNRGLGGLDAGLAALKAELGPVWADTVVVVVTEFGRTVAMNGTRGTDHGTAFAAFLAGGALKGGRVLADWPGLSPTALLDGRDLRPTADVRCALKSIVGDHLGVATAALNATVFPDATGAQPQPNLLKG
jgi:uncharacterized protein (DUF1501 family)